MDASGDSTHHGNGNGHPRPDHPDFAKLPSSDAAPQGAPVKPSEPESSAGSPPPPEPLVVIEKPKAKRPKKIADKPTLTREQQAVLAALEEGLSRSGACKAAKINRWTLYSWLNAVDDESRPTVNAVAFKAAFDESYKAGTEALIDEAKRRAVEGWDEPKFNKDGERVGTIRKYDSTLLMFLIKQRDPSYRERYEFTGAGGAPLNPDKVEHTLKYDLSALSDGELAQHNALLEKCLARSGGTPPSGAN